MKSIYVGIAVLCVIVILSWVLARVAPHSVAVSAAGASEVGTWLMNYYKSPRPDQAPRMLELILPALAKSMSPESYSPTVYAFARIAQLHPAALRGYESVFDRADHQGRLIILKIFEQAGDEQTREFLTARLRSKSEYPEISKLLQAGFPHKIDAVEREIQTGTEPRLRMGRVPF